MNAYAARAAALTLIGMSRPELDARPDPCTDARAAFERATEREGAPALVAALAALLRAWDWSPLVVESLIPAGYAPTLTIRRFCVAELGTAPRHYAGDIKRAPAPVPGLLDTVIEADGPTAEAAWAGLLDACREAGIDPAPLAAPEVADRYKGPAADWRDPELPAVPESDADGYPGPLHVFFAVMLDTGEAAPVPALAPFVRYVDADTVIERTRGPVTIERVMVPYMAQSTDRDRPWDASATEIAELRAELRITLHPSAAGTRIDLAWGGPTDEGHSHSEETIEQDTDEDGAPIWRVTGANSSSDCDGRMSRGWEWESDGGPGGVRSVYFPTQGDASAERAPAKTSQRDHAAEAAGY